MNNRYWAALVAPLLALPVPALAQADIALDAAADASAPADEGLSGDAPADEVAETITVPALTPILLEILADLGSNTSLSGDTFPIRLAEPIMIDGVETIPAGATGMGEVVHAKKSSGMGAAGELILTASYLEVGDRRVRLRSLKLNTQAQSRINTVNAINTASAATFLPIGMVGFFIKGGQVLVGNGSLAEARTAEEFHSDIPAGAIPAADESGVMVVPSEGAEPLVVPVSGNEIASEGGI